ncbi:Potential Na+/H+ antiporter subunit [Sterolibacterium denitrificans]|uniref:Potential Na+/H+ antiporter subunit n=1 Tax=Sterolibacterium denitrificans TaxID=157592 RepID=A0A7Z7MUP1_9PROT|nr:Na+/H+ antiporter subunit E [Sterolibacterium denitrificans]SMB22096.1 Potential Na+/H+ antiporter subunit [Sterolibacterium denitrificans]
MKRPLLVPLLPVVLTIVWLLLNDSLDFANLLLGIILAVLVSAAVTRLRPLSAWPRRLHVAIGLIWHVLLDIVRSNIGVGRIVLGAAQRQPTIGFLDIPLDLRDPHGLAMLAIIITSTPGTVWSGYDPASGMLTLHVLDLQDEAAWIRTIKHRYERPLMEIFE